MGCHQNQLKADPRLSYLNYSTLATSFFVFVTIAQLTNSLVPASLATSARSKSERRRSSSSSITGSGSGSDFHLANLTRVKTDEVATPSVEAGAHHRLRHRHSHRHEPKIQRQYGLLSQCSNKYVRVTGKHVDSRAGPNDQYALLRVETDGFGSQLRIQGSRSQNYLCFNRKGKLTVRASAGGDDRCVFRELLSLDRHFTEFQSAFDERWFVAFNRNGRSMDGDFWTKRPLQHKCRHFMKMDPADEANDDALKRKKNKKQGPEVDFHQLYRRLRSLPSQNISDAMNLNFAKGTADFSRDNGT